MHLYITQLIVLYLPSLSFASYLTEIYTTE